MPHPWSSAECSSSAPLGAPSLPHTKKVHAYTVFKTFPFSRIIARKVATKREKNYICEGELLQKTGL
jgi:hypothetical protein